MLDFRELKEFIVDVCKRRYPGHSFVYFYGTHSRNEGELSSDIDISVVYLEKMGPYRESFVEEGLIFDVFVYDVETLNHKIASARALLQTTILNIVSSSIALPFATEESQFLIRRAKEELRRGPREIKETFQMAGRLYLSNLIRDIVSSKSESERNFLAVDLFHTLANFAFTQHGIGGDVRKHYPRALQSIAPELFWKLNIALEKAIGARDFDPLIALAKDELEKIGGELRTNYKIPLSNANHLSIGN